MKTSLQQLVSGKSLCELLFEGSCELDRIKQVIETTLGMVLGIACKIERNEDQDFRKETAVTSSGYYWVISGELKGQGKGYSQLKLLLMNSQGSQLRLCSEMDWHVKKWSTENALIVYELLDDVVLKLFEIIPGLEEKCQVFLNLAQKKSCPS